MDEIIDFEAINSQETTSGNIIVQKRITNTMLQYRLLKNSQFFICERVDNILEVFADCYFHSFDRT